MESDNKFLKNLHSENTAFLNKALFGVSAIGIPVVIRILAEAVNSCVVVKISLLFAMFSLITSTGILLWSFFISEEAIEDLEDQKNESSSNKNKLVKKLNKLAFYCVLFGFLAVCVAAIFFTFSKSQARIDVMNKGKLVNDGITIPKSEYNKVSKKGLTIPKSEYAPKKGEPAKNSNDKNTNTDKKS
jgi:hypothetical protein